MVAIRSRRGACTVQACIAPWRLARSRLRATPARMLVEHSTKLHGHCLATCEGYRHIGNEPLNVACKLTIGRIAFIELFGMAEVGTTDRLLPRLDVPAPITRLRGFWYAGVALRFTALRNSHPRFVPSRFAMMHGRARGLVDDPSRLARRRFRFDPLPAKLSREPLAP